MAWRYWERWISEIFADFWSVARIGVASTLGLIGVMSLPRVFVFRVEPRRSPSVPLDPRQAELRDGAGPVPASRSGTRVDRLWESFYPRVGLAPDYRALLAAFESTMPEFVELLLTHRPASLRGRSLAEVMDTAARSRPVSPSTTERGGAAPARLRRIPPVARLRRHRTGQGRRPDQPGGREPNAGRPALLLGAPQHASTTRVERPPGRVGTADRERWNRASTKEDVMADEKNDETPDRTLAKPRHSDLLPISGGSNGDDVPPSATVDRRAGARRRSRRRPDQSLWTAIRFATDQLSYNKLRGLSGDRHVRRRGSDRAIDSKSRSSRPRDATRTRCAARARCPSPTSSRTAC